MALIKCPECKKKISDQCSNCPHCGYPIQSDTQLQNLDNVEQPNNTNKKPFYKKAWVWIVAGVVLAAIIVGAFFLLNHDTKPKLDAEGNRIFVNLTNEVYTNAKKYKGYHINIKGQVFQVMSDNGNTKGIQIWLDPDTCEQNIMIYYNTDVEVKQGDYIICSGYIDSVTKYENAYGATLYAPLVISSDLKQATYIDVMAPTTFAIILKNLIKQEQFGYSVSVDKVEFSKKETRVYVTATNNGSAKFYFGDAVIVQDGKQYEEINNFEAAYTEVPFELVKGVSSSGIILFPAMDVNTFELTISVHSDNYDEELGEFAFIIDKDNSTTDVEMYRAMVAANKFKNDNKDVILTIYTLYDHLQSLGYSDSVCNDVSLKKLNDGFYDIEALYDYERIQKYSKDGYSRDAIINYYMRSFSYEEAAYLVDECLTGRKLTYEYVNDGLVLVEH